MPQINRILVPIDFSAGTETSVEYAIMLAGRFGASIHLLHAYHPTGQPEAPWAYSRTYLTPVKLLEEMRNKAERALLELRDQIAAHGLEATIELYAGHPAIGITEAANRLPADLIVMGTRGRTGIKHVLLGSVTDRTLRLAPCPVLVVNPAEDQNSSGP